MLRVSNEIVGSIIDSVDNTEDLVVRIEVVDGEKSQKKLVLRVGGQWTKESDKKFKQENITFYINLSLYHQLRDHKIEYRDGQYVCVH